MCTLLGVVIRAIASGRRIDIYAKRRCALNSTRYLSYRRRDADISLTNSQQSVKCHVTLQFSRRDYPPTADSIFRRQVFERTDSVSRYVSSLLRVPANQINRDLTFDGVIASDGSYPFPIDASINMA